MEVTKMKRGFIFLTVLTLAAILLAGCAVPTDSSLKPGTGFGAIEVRVTDALPDNIDHVEVYFSEVSVHKAAEEPDGQGEWIDIEVENGWIEDLIALGAGGLYELIAEDERIEAGTYTQLRVVIDESEGKGVLVTYTDDDITHHRIPAKLPSGTLKFVHPFDVVDSTTTIITLDFIVEESLVFTGAISDYYNEANEQYEPKIICKPVVKLSVEQEWLVGSIGGHVTESGIDHPTFEANVVVEGTELSAVTDENGYYEIVDVPVGAGMATYTVTVTADGYRSSSCNDVEVCTNATSTCDFTLEPESI